MPYFCPECQANITGDVLDFVTNPGTYVCNKCGIRFNIRIEIEPE